jgi:hypothetical protein
MKEITTLKELEVFLKNKEIQLSIVMLGLDKRNLRIDIVGPAIFAIYNFTYQKNHRGIGYFHYEDWIYTEYDFVKKIIEDFPPPFWYIKKK